MLYIYKQITQDCKNGLLFWGFGRNRPPEKKEVKIMAGAKKKVVKKAAKKVVKKVAEKKK